MITLLPRLGRITIIFALVRLWIAAGGRHAVWVGVLEGVSLETSSRWESSVSGFYFGAASAAFSFARPARRISTIA